MDGKRFDSLTMRITRGNSRRDLVQGFAAGGLAFALGVFGLGRDVTEAGNHKHHHKHHHKKKVAVTISTNAVNGFPLGHACSVANDCALGLVCVGKRCRNCGGGAACTDLTKCCLIGDCSLVGGIEVCV